MLNLILDTNTLFNPTDLRQLATNPQYVLWGSILNIVETISDIVDDASFSKARSQLRILREVAGKNLLPDPDRLFRRDIGYYIKNAELDIWQLMIDIVISANTLEECVKGKANETLGIFQKLNVQEAQEWRQACGSAFLNDTTRMIQSLNRSAVCTENTWQVKMEERELSALRHFFRFSEADEMMVRAVLERNGITSTMATRDVFERALSILTHFTKAYQGYLLKIFQDNTKPRENDYNDLHLTMAIWRPGWILVTQESKLREWMRLGGVASPKYASIEELLRG